MFAAIASSGLKAEKDAAMNIKTPDNKPVSSIFVSAMVSSVFVEVVV